MPIEHYGASDIGLSLLVEQADEQLNVVLVVSALCDLETLIEKVYLIGEGGDQLNIIPPVGDDYLMVGPVPQAQGHQGEGVLILALFHR